MHSPVLQANPVNGRKDPVLHHISNCVYKAKRRLYGRTKTIKQISSYCAHQISSRIEKRLHPHIGLILFLTGLLLVSESLYAAQIAFVEPLYQLCLFFTQLFCLYDNCLFRFDVDFPK